MVRAFGFLAGLLLVMGMRPASAQLPLPFSPTCVTSPFGARNAAEPRASHFHTGVDLRAPAGTWVHAVVSGTVVSIERLGAGGLVVEVRHSPDLSTRYEHLGTVSPALQMGKRLVAQGDILGRVGRTGIAYGPHLHFELWLHGKVVDPAPVLGVQACPS